MTDGLPFYIVIDIIRPVNQPGQKVAARILTKPLSFMGAALDDLRDFPRSARREAGFQLDKVQKGDDPDDWKPMPVVGSGACEIRIRDEAGAFRVLYVAKYPEAVVLLHAFQKKTRKTTQKDIDLAKERYRDMTQRRQKP
jgi:phage-related protein